ncbi:hypothetical protein V6N13_077249 [Hibiscus sabdariffa]|uniref:Uncharacterized protein n=2 Tax=Hibiscus sabdariffa TaxID=183260 RepID=A0ABR2CNB4_9ROSI
MDQSQQLLQHSSFAFLSQSSNSISNPPSSSPQPPKVPPQPFLCPPGAHPHAHQGHLVVPRVEPEAHAQFNENRNGASQSCDVTLPVAGLNSSGNNDGLNQSLVNNVISTPKQTGMVQPLQCDVCNIWCQAQDFEKHIVGKKHRRNLRMKSNSSSATFPEPSDGANAQELERKKQKLLDSGAAYSSIQVCTICNVACNSREKLAEHLSGRKHAAQAGQIAVVGIGPDLAAFRANHHFCNEGKKKTRIPQSSWCQVCQIDVYAKHLSGKKHLKNVENLEKSKNGTHDSSVGTPAATSLMIKSVENQAANGSYIVNVKYWDKMAAESKSSKEELNKSIRKVVEGGVANNSCSVNVQNPDKMVPVQSEASKEDLEMMKQKVMEGGSVADAVANSSYGDSAENPEKMTAQSDASKEDWEMRKQKVIEAGVAAAVVVNSSYDVNVRNPEKMAEQSGAPKKDMETKEQKTMEGGVAAASVANGSYSVNVQNTEEMAAQSGASKEYLETKKQKLMEGVPAAAVVANSSYAVNVQNPEKMAAQSGASKEYLETKKQKVMEGATAATAVAVAVANSSYSVNVQNLEKMVAQSESSKEDLEMKLKVMEAGGVSVQNPEKMGEQSQASKDGLQTKKRKLIESGTAAAAVMSCTFCNVVCNSQQVFKCHLAGKKHVAMVKKQASAEYQMPLLN